MQPYIVWLPSWYPTAIAPFDGDFIQRHAKAVSIYKKIIVVFVKKDTAGIVTTNKKIIENKNGNLTEIICYYKPFTTGMKFIDAIISFFSYYFFFLQTVTSVIKKNGAPALLHTHVVNKTAWLSLRLKKKWKVPLIVTEHWTGFLPDTLNDYKKINPLFRLKWKKLFEAADAITVVSDVLGKGLQVHFDINKYSVIPNVVDSNIFFPVINQKNETPVFIRISLGGSQKNMPDLLSAFGILQSKKIDFRLHLFLPDKTVINQLVLKYNLNDKIIFHDEVPQQELAKTMQQADALVLYSHYETFGCVIIEANATGIPAILSDLPVFKEFCLENKTSLFAEGNNPEKLAAVMIDFIKNRDSFDKNEIAGRTKELFSFEVVGKQFNDLYESLT